MKTTEIPPQSPYSNTNKNLSHKSFITPHNPSKKQIEPPLLPVRLDLLLQG